MLWNGVKWGWKLINCMMKKVGRGWRWLEVVGGGWKGLEVVGGDWKGLWRLEEVGGG